MGEPAERSLPRSGLPSATGEGRRVQSVASPRAVVARRPGVVLVQESRSRDADVPGLASPPRSAAHRVPDVTAQERLRAGRPRDAELTRRLLHGALALVADDGFHRLNADVLSVRVGAGKAGVYRRWSDTTALLADAVTQLTLIEAVEPTRDLRGDLLALLTPWRRPLNTGERAVAALLGPSRQLDALGTAVRATVTVPLTIALEDIIARHAARGHHVSPTQRQLLVGLVQALWWDRYLADRPPSTTADVEQLVDLVLLPVTRTIEPATPSRPEPRPAR